MPPLDPLRRNYDYRQLETQNTFRLLSLHAGRGDKIECSIHHHILGSPECPHYRAISYTWGKDNPRFPIHFPEDDSVIVVGENLRSALRFIRDHRSDCYVWADAICIDQRRTEERNHQVRLMAQIYGNANIVLVWLQSAGEKSDDAARAFEFVSAAVKFDTTEHSVYNYSKRRSSNNENNELASEWHSLHKMCSMRYWTRKWIIQELVKARTVVLQVGTSTCSMTDFEEFCRQLHQNKNEEAYQSLGETTDVFGSRRGIWTLILGSSAARLALQRLETQDQGRPGLLHELIERYARNQCGLPCDHVYALYSLVGDHRVHLSVDYGQTYEQRLVNVVDFVNTYERLHPSKVLDFVTLLMELFNLSTEHVVHRRSLAGTLNLVTQVSAIGSVVLELETAAARTLRDHVKPLQSMPLFRFDTRQDPWAFTVSEGHNVGTTGIPDMAYFSIAGTEKHGLAACRLEAGDVIWQLPGAKLAFAVRSMPDQNRVQIIGRAYLYRTADAATRDDVTSPSTRLLAMDLATLLELGSLAFSSKDKRSDVEDVVLKRSAVMVGIGGLWQRRLKLVSMTMTTLAVAFVVGMIIIDIHFVHGVPL